MSTIKISPDLSVAVTEYATQGNAFLGSRGTGKTTSAKGIVEQLIDHDVPNAIFDPTSMWKHMKTAAPYPGGRGFDVVVAGAGPDADLPLTVKNAGDIMRAAMKGRVNIVFDLKSLEDEADWHRVLQAAVKVMFRENETYGIRHIVIEEASEFCAQDTTSKEEFASRALVNRVVKLGGNSSLGVTLVAQRAEDVSKKALNNCASLFLHGQRGSQSLQAIERWMKYADKQNAQKIATELTMLTPGACYVWMGHQSPVRVQMPQCHSYHPDRKKPVVSTQLKQPTDVSRWVEKLKGMLPKAEEKPAPISHHAIIAGPRPAPNPIIQQVEVEKIVNVPILSEDDRHYMSCALVELRKVMDRMNDIVHRADDALLAMKNRPAPKLRPMLTEKKKETLPAGDKILENFPDTSIDPDQSIKLTPRYRSVLNVLAQFGAMPDNKLAAFVGLSSGVGNWRNIMTSLKMAGWVVGEPSHRELTQSGRAILGELEALPTGSDLVDYWVEKLPGRAGEMLRQLFDYGQLSDDQIGELIGIKAGVGNFRNNMSELLKRDLVTGPPSARRIGEVFLQ